MFKRKKVRVKDNLTIFKIIMTKVAYLFGTLDLQSTFDKLVAAAHYGKPSLLF